MDNLAVRVAFDRVPGIGRAKIAMLETFFGDLESAWSAGASDLERAGLDKKTANGVVAVRARTSPDDEMELLRRADVQALSPNSDDFPPLLREIYDVPAVLYVRGRILPQDQVAVAMVGTRRATAYGRQVAEQLAADLAKNRVTVVSGLAKGIDAIAHRAVLDAGGRTIAVQACGLDLVYPSSHVNLAREIADSGALVSDYPLGTRPRAQFFPRRNRILSGLTLATLVVEAPEASGALITARLAMEQNRDVLAVPGGMFSPMSRGTNKLIQDGAKLVSSVDDILEELNMTAVSLPLEPAQLSLDLSTAEAQLLRQLNREPRHIDEIRQAVGVPIAELSSTLAMLELSGLAKQVGAMHFVIGREVQERYEVGT